MANLKEVSEIISDYENAGPLGVTKQLHADLAESLAYVGGVMSLKNGSSPANDLTIAGGWNRCDGLFTNSVDTRGVQDGLADGTDPGAWFRVKNKGAGDWEFTAGLRITVDTAGDYDFRIAKNVAGVSENTPFVDTVTAGAGDTILLSIAGGLEKGVSHNDRLQPEIKGPNGAVVTAIAGQFRAKRG